MAAFSFTPTYQDYLASNPQLAGGSEAGSPSYLSQDAWNALSPDAQWSNLGGGLALAPSDPRFAAVWQQLQAAGASPDQANRVIRLGSTSNAQPFNGTYYNNPSQVLQGNGVFATSQGNLTPLAQMGNTGGLSDGMWALSALGLLGGGATLGGMLGGAGAGGAAGVSGSSALTTGGFGTDIGAGSGTFGAAGGAGSAGALADANPGDSYWNMTASNNTDVPVGDGAPVTDNSISYPSVVDHSFNSPGGVLGNLMSGNYGSALGQAGSWAMAHPLQAAGLLQTGYGLIRGGSKPSTTSTSGSSGNKGGSGTPTSVNVPGQQFYTNPYIAAQIARGYQ